MIFMQVLDLNLFLLVARVLQPRRWAICLWVSLLLIKLNLMCQRQANQNTETPCVGICSTIYGDNVCRGCFRSAQEVVDWNAYQQDQKLLILQRLNQNITEVISSKLHIFDSDLLKSKCQHY